MSLWLKFRGRLVYRELKDEDYCPSFSWFDFHVFMLPICGTQGTIKQNKGLWSKGLTEKEWK